MCKCGLIENLPNRSFRLCSETLKSIFKQNNYSQNFVNHCINKFLTKLFN